MAEEGKPRKTDRRVIKTQKAIRNAFHKLLIEKDIDKITVSALAREADIDRKTFYLHFPSVDALIEKEASEIVERVAAALSTPASSPDESSSSYMKRVLVELANVAEENAELYRRVISSLSIDQMVEALHEPVYEAACKAGGNKPVESPAGFDYAIRFYIAGTLSVFTQWFINDRERPIDSVVDIVERAVSGTLPFLENHPVAQAV